MMEKIATATLNTLAEMVLRYAPAENANRTTVPNLACIRINSEGEHLPEVYQPCICLVVQGAKTITYGKEIFVCNAGDYMMIPVTMPILGTVTCASPARPYLCLQCSIDLSMAGEVSLAGNLDGGNVTSAARSLFVASMSAGLGEALLRLARLLDAPDDIAVLAPLYHREICYRLLKSEHGQHIAHLRVYNGVLQKISRAISYINTNYTKIVRSNELADIAEMGHSALHQHFKEITTLTPLQFQKQLRLIEAKRMMTVKNIGAAEAAYAVGYESPSQFSREYARMFGYSPGKEAQKTKHL